MGINPKAIATCAGMIRLIALLVSVLNTCSKPQFIGKSASEVYARPGGSDDTTNNIAIMDTNKKPIQPSKAKGRLVLGSLINPGMRARTSTPVYGVGIKHDSYIKQFKYKCI